MLLQCTMTLKYDLRIICFFSFMDFHKNLRNLREKVKKLYGLTYKMTCISAVKSPIVLKMVSNGFYGNIKPSCTTIFELLDILFEEN